VLCNISGAALLMKSVERAPVLLVPPYDVQLLFCSTDDPSSNL